MSDAGQREWRFCLDDTIGFAGKVLAYTDGLDQAGFMASGLTYDATLRNLELLGEAAARGSAKRGAVVKTGVTSAVLNAGPLLSIT